MKIKTTAAQLQAGDVLVSSSRTVEAVTPLTKGSAVEVKMRDAAGQPTYAWWQAGVAVIVERAEK